jgi:hypothetical protein
MEIASTDCRLGNGTRVHEVHCCIASFLMAILVFSKQEIVFARTSPQHKLEIGESQNSLLIMHVLIMRISQTRTSIRPHCRRLVVHLGYHCS